MSNWQSHPEEAALVRLVDGELSAAEARDLDRHLADCPACRAEVEGLRATVADCIRYRREVLQTLLPAPPRPWADLGDAFARIDRSCETATERPRWWRAPVLRWGLAAAAAAILTVGVFQQLRETPSVQAATLLHKAEAAAAARPIARHRLMFRTKTFQFTRLAGVAGTLPQEPASPALEALFQEAHWDWNDPLSARAFAAWRDPLPQKTDTVDRTGDMLQIRTVTSGGPLAAASLTLRAGDLIPMRGRLEFRNQEWVEMSDVADAPEQSEASSTAPRAAEPTAHGTEPAGTVPAVSETALLSSELHVLLKLHEIGADLGDPVPVTVAGGRVQVSGVGLAPERQRQIEAALAGIPNVSVQFSEPALPPAGTEPPATAPAPAPQESASAGGIAARVERQLGGRPQFERFSSQMLDWTEAGMERAYALRRLAEQFPPAQEASLDPADRLYLRTMAREHAAALVSLSGKVTRSLDPVLTGMGGQPATASSSAETWQAAAEDLLKTAQRVDRSLSILMGAAPADGSAFSPSEVLADLARMEADLARCQRLLGRE